MASVRGTQIKQSVAALDWLGPGAKAEVLSRLSPDTLSQIEAAVRVQWLPHALAVELCHRVREVSGEEAVRGWSRASVTSALNGSLYGPFVNGIVTVFGLSPVAAWKILPKAYLAAFRDCGELQVLGVEAGSAEMAFHDLPPEGRDRDWLVSVAGGFEAIFDLCRVEGRVDLELRELRPDPRFHATWRTSR
ncbi:MAG TPA: hypothetical protein VMT70_24355 [Vicinamibacteria bacterium]|nr:hypothetical protein [Vicinamibacteria bacterium]